MELYILDPKKWISFLISPAKFFRKKMDPPLKQLIVELALFMGLIFAIVNGVNGLYLLPIFLSLVFLGVLMVYGLSKIFNGAAKFNQNAYSFIFPSLIFYLMLFPVIYFLSISGIKWPVPQILTLLFSTTYTALAISEVNKFSKLKGIVIVIAIYGFIAAIVSILASTPNCPGGAC